VSFYYAPLEKVMFLLFKNDEDDAMVVRFNGHAGNYGADPRFDLDDGFISSVPSSMIEAFMKWSEEHDRDPAVPLLTLEAPFDVMTRPQKRKAETQEVEEVTQKEKKRKLDEQD
jgi:hypothetical protein